MKSLVWCYLAGFAVKRGFLPSFSTFTPFACVGLICVKCLDIDKLYLMGL